MSNLYDQIEVNINILHQRFGSEPNMMSRRNRKNNIITSSFYKVLYKLNIYQKLIDSGFIRGWFAEFQEYWNTILGGRPLLFHDFYFLYSSYRTKFAQVEVKHRADENDFLMSWQRPENIFLIFKEAYLDALSPFAYYPYRRYIKRGDQVLEYGCGSAPIVTSLINDSNKHLEFTLADLPQYTYHFAKWRLRQHGVNFIDLSPHLLPRFKNDFNLIFLTNVLEHLPKPLDTVRHLTENLKSNGYLIFDYILGDGAGLDTLESVNDRALVLDYLKENYLIVKGSLEYTKSMGSTIAQKVIKKIG